MSTIEQFGELSEQVIRSRLRDAGYVVYSLDSKDNYVSGDNLVAAPSGRIVFLDAKGKTQSTYWRNGQQEEHGIDYNTWQRYMQICEARNLEGLIAVYERFRERAPFGKQHGLLEPSGAVLLYELNSSPSKPQGKPRINRDTARSYGKGGMTYWHRDDYIDLL